MALNKTNKTSTSTDGAALPPTELAVMENLVSEGVLVKAIVDRKAADAPLGSSRLVRVAAPTDIILSRSYPGNHILAVSGLSADEAIARTLARKLDTSTALAAFSITLSTPGIIARIIEQLYPRVDQPLKGRQYSVSEDRLTEVIGKVMPTQEEEVRAAYGYVCTKMLHEMGVLIISEQRQVVFSHGQYTATVEDMKAALLISAIRGVFDESRMRAAVAELAPDMTPRLIGERLGRLFRSFAIGIPQIAKELEYANIALAATREYILSPETLPLELAANTDLATLASYANILLAVINGHQMIPSVTTHAIETRARAAKYLVQALASTDMLETVDLSGYAKHFYEVPATSGDGERRGAVIGKRFGQKSRMSVVNALPSNGGLTKLTEQDPGDVRASVIAPMIDQTITSDASFTLVMNLLADDLANKLSAEGDAFSNPELWSFQVTTDDIQYLAMHRSRGLSVVEVTIGAREGVEAKKAFTFLYSVSALPGWRMSVSAATSSEVQFADPQSVVLYTSGATQVAGTPLPIREQGIGSKIMQEVIYLGDMSGYLHKSIARTFGYTLAVAGIQKPLELQIPVLSEFLTEVTNQTTSEGMMYLAAVAERNSDSEVRNIFGVISSYMNGSDKDLSDKASSWVITTLLPMMAHPSVVELTQYVVRDAIVRAGIDTRRLAIQNKEMMARGLLAVVLGFLNRFGKVTPKQVETMVTKLPVTTITTQASEALTKMATWFR